MAPTARISGTIRSKNPLKGAVEVLPERLYYAALKQPPPSHNILASTPKRGTGGAKGSSTPTERGEKKQIHFFNMDNELVYWNFFLDFGPLNLGQLTRFCQKLNDKLRKFPVVCFYSSTVPSKRANAIFLMCAWQMLFLGRNAEQAYAGFDDAIMVDNSANCSWPPTSSSQGAPTLAPLPPFHDASPCACTYDLTVLDCLKGLAKARSCGFFELDTFDVEEYEYFEQVENGDLNWIVKGKILAFAGPSFERHVSPEGYCTLAPADYIPYYQKRNVTLVVRLNKKCYEEQDFVDAGIDHLEAFFLDGSCPPMKILQQVLQAFEAVPPGQAFAVHCKAGLGRTGTVIGAYLMKHYQFTASEAIAWMRICRPGMVIGPQQHFLQQIEARMWQEGATYRKTHVPIWKPPTDAVGSNSSSAPSSSSRMVVDTSSGAAGSAADDEAVSGRSGQAEGLLAARQGRGGRGGSSNSRTMSTPITPDQQEKAKAVAVTPDQPKAANLWF